MGRMPDQVVVKVFGCLPVPRRQSFAVLSALPLARTPSREKASAQIGPWCFSRIPAAGGDGLALAERRHGRDLVGVADEDFLDTEVARRPDLDHPVESGAGQKFAVP